MNNKSVKTIILNGIGWSGSIDTIQHILQLIFTALLVRLLSVSDFGIVAMSLLVIRFVRAITQIGFGSAIIQKKDIKDYQISAIFFFQLILHFSLSVIIYLSSELVSNFFNESDLEPIVKALGWILALQTFQFPLILLRKNLNFKAISIIEISSMILSNIIAIILAFLNFGVWSLIARLFLNRAISSLLSWIYLKWKPVKPRTKGLKPLVQYGLNMLGSNIFNFFSENLIGILTGKFLGKEAMGLFSIAFNLAIVPATKVQKILTSVLLPVFSTIQNDIKLFRSSYKKTLFYTSIIFLPFMFFVSGASENILLNFYGPKLSNANNLLLILSFVGSLRGLSHLLRSSLLAKGKSNIIFYATVIEVCFSVPLLIYWMNNYGIYGLMAGYFLGAIIGTSYISYYFNKLIFDESVIFKTIYKSLLLSIIIFICSYLIGMLKLHVTIELFMQIGISLLIFFNFLKLYNIDYKGFINNR